MAGEKRQRATRNSGPAPDGDSIEVERVTRSSARKRRRISSPPRDQTPEDSDDDLESLVVTRPRSTPPNITPARTESDHNEDLSWDDTHFEPDHVPPDAPTHTSLDSPCQRLLARIVDERLAGRRKVSFRGNDDERQKIHSLLEQTIEAGEGNSLLVIGPRGCGKSRIVADALADIVAAKPQPFHVVRLSGLIHTDDKLALREIWRQLGKDLEPDETEEQAQNYADTLAKLLAVLSHPAELAGGAPGMVADAVVFVLDEFDLFAAHARQTLLYNLFDIAQSRKAPIAVLGLTTRVNAVEMLEKRVKSRFSHRYVFLRPHESLAAFRDSCLAALSLSGDDLALGETSLLLRDMVNGSPSTSNDVQMKRNKASHDPQHKSAPPPPSPDETARDRAALIARILADWNASMAQLTSRADVARSLAHVHYTTNSYPTGLSTLRAHLHAARHGGPYATPLPPDSKLSLLPQLSLLALMLLICAARLDVILGAAAGCNFGMAHDEYASLVARARLAHAGAGAVGAGGLGGRVWSRALGREAWAVLVELELLVPASGVVGPRASVGDAEMVRCDVALEEIAGAVPGLEGVLVRWCKEI